MFEPLVLSFCIYLFCRFVLQVGCHQGKCVVGATKALPEHCWRVGSSGRLVGRKGTLLSWEYREEVMVMRVGVRFGTTTCMNLMAKLWGTHLPVKAGRLLGPACCLPLKSGQLPATVWRAVGKVNQSYFKQSSPKEQAIWSLLFIVWLWGNNPKYYFSWQVLSHSDAMVLSSKNLYLNPSEK